MDELKEMKAEAYDCMVQIESWQKKLQEINIRIAKAVQECNNAMSEKSEK